MPPRMNPYFITNTLLACLIAFKVLVLAYNRTIATEIELVVLLIAAFKFHMGMVPISEYFTGQKTITMWSFYDGTKIRRDKICLVIYTLTYSVFAAYSGAPMIIIVGS